MGAVGLFAVAVLVLILFFYRRNKGNMDYSWVQENKYIIHALGGIEGYSYTNSREALISSYEKGARLLEADIEYTSDGELVLFHNWKKKTLREILDYETEEDEEPLTLNEFLGRKIYGRFSPMTFKELMEFMKEHPDMLLVLDGKYDREEDIRRQYSDIYNIAMEYDRSIPDRMIPQIYNEDMLKTIKEIYDWRSVIFTWYKLDEDTLDPLEIFKFCRRNGIRVCTMEDKKENPLIDETASKFGVSVYVHTINDEETYKRLMDSGVSGIYTDFLFEGN